MNSVNLTGRLAKDMEVKPTKNDKQMLKYSVAVTIGWGDNKKTLWVNCMQFFGFSEKYLGKKGDLIGITGELDFWEAGTEKKVQMIYCTVNRFDILSSKSVEKVQETFSGKDKTETAEKFNDASPFDDSDLPF